MIYALGRGLTCNDMPAVTPERPKPKTFSLAHVAGRSHARFESRVSEFTWPYRRLLGEVVDRVAKLRERIY